MLAASFERDQEAINRSLDSCFQILSKSRLLDGQKDKRPSSAPSQAALSNGRVAAHEALTNGIARADTNGHAQYSSRELPDRKTQLARHDAELAAAKQAAQDGRILAAQKALHAFGKAHGVESSALTERSSAMGLDAASIEQKAQLVTESLQELKDDSGWMVSSKANPRVLYRHHRGSPVHSLKLSATLSAPMEHVLALAVEYDLTKQWNPIMRESLILYQHLPWVTCLYGAMWTPVVVFDVPVYAEGFDLGEEDRCLLVAVRTMTQDEIAQHGPLPAAAARRRRGAVNPGSCFRCEALPPTADGRPRTSITILAHLEPRLPYVPSFLVNFVLKVAGPIVLGAVQKVLNTLFQDPEGVFQQRLKAHSEVYEMCRARRAELFKKFYGVEE